MSIWDVYKRALAMLVVERAQTVWVVLSGIALGIVPIAEQVLLARVVDALALGQGAFPDHRPVGRCSASSASSPAWSSR